MTTAMFHKIKPQKIGSTPVVVVPLKDWRKIEEIIEEYHAEKSSRYRASIRAAREQIKQGKIHRLNAAQGTFTSLRAKWK